MRATRALRRIRTTAWPLALALVAACQATGLEARHATTKASPSAPASAGVAATSSAPLLQASATPTPAAGGQATPTPGPTATPGLLLAEPDLLKAPAGGSLELSGAIQLDTAYIVASGGGNVIGHNGSAVIAAGGGSVVAQGAGNVVAQGAGNIIASGAGNVISHNGSAVIAQGAGNVVASGGGNVVAQGAGNVLSHNGSAYRLAQAADGAVTSDGTLHAVAGMPLGVFSLKTHEPVPVGVDKDNKPVYTVNTDLDGHYHLYLPPGTADNVLVVAHVDPDSPDPRYHYAVATPVKPNVAFGEDAALLTLYIRKGFVPRLVEIMTSKDPNETSDRILSGFSNASTALKQVLVPLVRDLRAESDAAGLNLAPPDAVYQVALRAVDILISHMDLGEDPAVGSPFYIHPQKYWDGQQELLLPAMRDVFEVTRRQTAAALAKDPFFFAKQGYFNTVNVARHNAGLPAYQVQRPEDLGTFMVEEVFAVQTDDELAPKMVCYPDGTITVFGMLSTVLESIGAEKIEHLGTEQAPLPVTSSRFGQADRVEAAYVEILTQIVSQLQPGTPSRGEIDQMLRDYGKTPFPTIATPTPGPTPAVKQVDPCASGATSP